MNAGTKLAHGVMGPQGLMSVCPAPPSHPHVIGTHTIDFTALQAIAEASSLMLTVAASDGLLPGQFGDGVGPPPQQHDCACSPLTASDLPAALDAQPPTEAEARHEAEGGPPDCAKERSHQEPPVRDEEHGSATRR